MDPTASVQPRATLLGLPNELLLHILQPLNTLTLLPLTSICHQLHHLIISILQRRFDLDPVLADSISLLAYQPYRKYHEGNMLGQYLGTDAHDHLRVSSDSQSRGDGLQEMNNLYSRFRPYKIEPKVQFQWRHPAGDVPGSRTYRPISDTIPTVVTSGTSPEMASAPAASRAPSEQEAPPTSSPESDPITQILKLDAGDLFTQLCANATISVPGPKPGLFHGYQPVHKEGVIRVWRHWLHSRARASEPSSDDSVLWVNNTKNIGIRFLVRYHGKEVATSYNLPCSPAAVDEEVSESFEVQYVELVVRTRELVCAGERMREEMEREGGKAIVFGNWV